MLAVNYEIICQKKIWDFWALPILFLSVFFSISIDESKPLSNELNHNNGRSSGHLKKKQLKSVNDLSEQVNV